MPSTTYFVRFYIDGEFSDEFEHATSKDAFDHAKMFTSEDGYNLIEVSQYSWSDREEKKLYEIAF